MQRMGVKDFTSAVFEGSSIDVTAPFSIPNNAVFFAVYLAETFASYKN